MQEVLVPCRRFDVEVTFGVDEGLGIIDQFVLRTVAGGARTVHAVAEQLGLPTRMAFDAMLSLLNAGWLTVQHHGELDVAPQILEALGDAGQPPPEDWSKPFVSRHPGDFRSVVVTQEMVSGCVFSLRRGPAPEREGLLQMPRAQGLPEPDEIPNALLIPVVVAGLRDPRARSSGLRADLTGLAPGLRITNLRVRRVGTSVSSRPSVVQTMVIAVPAPDGGPPQVRVVGPDGMPSRVRASISAALNTLRARNLGRASFFDRLKVAPPSDDVQDGFIESPAKLLEPLAANAAALATVSLEDHARVHRQLRDTDDEASPILEHLSAYEANADLVTGAAATFQDRAIAALSRARHQVVLACPWIGQLGAPRWREAISQAADRGVSVVLIWGMDSTEATPESREGTIIAQMSQITARDTGASRRIVIAARGATNHAKVIVQDVDSVVVSSCNYLNAATSSTTTEVGITISGIEERRASLPALEILRWLARTVPDPGVRSRILVDALHFNRVEHLGSLPAGPPPVTEVAFEAGTGPFASLGQQAGLKVWREAWKKRIAWLENARSIAGRAALMIADGQHRDLLVHAIANARARLGIASHSVRAHGLSARIQDLLLQARERGVDVRIVAGYLDERTTDSAARDRLDHLASRGIAIRLADNHAKAIVCDDWVVASSFNFLGQDPSSRSAHDLGVRVFDERQSETAWRALFADGEDCPG